MSRGEFGKKREMKKAGKATCFFIKV